MNTFGPLGYSLLAYLYAGFLVVWLIAFLWARRTRERWERYHKLMVPLLIAAILFWMELWLGVLDQFHPSNGVQGIWIGRLTQWFNFGAAFGAYHLICYIQNKRNPRKQTTTFPSELVQSPSVRAETTIKEKQSATDVIQIGQ